MLVGLATAMGSVADEPAKVDTSVGARLLRSGHDNTAAAFLVYFHTACDCKGV